MLLDNGIIGKRFRDAGLKDICIESGIVAEGSVNGVLDGKHYNRAVRVHKCIPDETGMGRVHSLAGPKSQRANCFDYIFVVQSK